jgi:hypothetical protein
MATQAIEDLGGPNAATAGKVLELLQQPRTLSYVNVQHRLSRLREKLAAGAMRRLGQPAGVATTAVATASGGSSGGSQCSGSSSHSGSCKARGQCGADGGRATPARAGHRARTKESVKRRGQCRVLCIAPAPGSGLPSSLRFCCGGVNAAAAAAGAATVVSATAGGGGAGAAIVEPGRRGKRPAAAHWIGSGYSGGDGSEGGEGVPILKRAAQKGHGQTLPG